MQQPNGLKDAWPSTPAVPTRCRRQGLSDKCGGLAHLSSMLAMKYVTYRSRAFMRSPEGPTRGQMKEVCATTAEHTSHSAPKGRATNQAATQVGLTCGRGARR